MCQTYNDHWFNLDRQVNQIQTHLLPKLNEDERRKLALQIVTSAFLDVYSQTLTGFSFGFGEELDRLKLYADGLEKGGPDHYVARAQVSAAKWVYDQCNQSLETSILAALATLIQLAGEADTHKFLPLLLIHCRSTYQWLGLSTEPIDTLIKGEKS